jgi:nucleotide-binding universal stress UspA family protein
MARVVVGVDESDCSRQALAWAMDEARLRQATLEVIYAYGATSGWVGMGEVVGVGATMPENFSEDDVARAAKAVLDAEVDQATAGRSDVDLVLRTVPLQAGDALVEASEGADLVVVGTHGRSDLRRALLGSVSSHCIHHAHCPVVVVRARAADAPAKGDAPPRSP